MNFAVACGAMAKKNAQIVKAAAMAAPTAKPNPQTLSFITHLRFERVQINSNPELFRRFQAHFWKCSLWCLFHTRLHSLRHLFHHAGHVAHHLRHVFHLLGRHFTAAHHLAYVPHHSRHLSHRFSHAFHVFTLHHSLPLHHSAHAFLHLAHLPFISFIL